MIYTYLFALILFLIALYIAEHLYFKDGNNKIHNITIYHLIPFIVMLILPYINICAGICTILGVITKNYYVEYYYTGIFKNQITKLINIYNNFLWQK